MKARKTSNDAVNHSPIVSKSKGAYLMKNSVPFFIRASSGPFLEELVLLQSAK